MKKLMLTILVVLIMAIPAMAAEDPVGFRLFLIAKQKETENLTSLYRLRVPNLTANGLDRTDHYVGLNYTVSDWLTVEGTAAYVLIAKGAPNLPKYSTPMARFDLKMNWQNVVLGNAVEFFTRWESFGIYNFLDYQPIEKFHLGIESYNLINDWVSKRAQNSYNIGPYFSRDFGKVNVMVYYRFHARPDTRMQNSRSVLITLTLPFSL